MKQIPNYEHDKCSTFWTLARLAYPEDRNKNLGNALPSPYHNAILDPDEHMLCFDYLYYACAAQVGSTLSSAVIEFDAPPRVLSTITRTRLNGNTLERICTGRRR